MVDKKEFSPTLISGSSGMIPPEEESRSTCEERYSGLSSACRNSGGLPKTLLKRNGLLLLLKGIEN